MPAEHPQGAERHHPCQAAEQEDGLGSSPKPGFARRMYPPVCWSEQGSRKPLASPAPAAWTQALLSGAREEAGMENDAGGTGEETDLPLPSRGAGP